MTLARRPLSALLAVALPLVSAPAQTAPPAAIPLAVGTTGMVSTAHPVATRAGVDVLAAGGNAFDAAIAIAATLNVVEPMMSGIGGYGTILVYDAKQRRTRFLNASGRIPAAVDADLFREPTPNFRENRRGAKAVSTPGNVHAWDAMFREYGTRPWRTLFEPAVRAAEDGYVLSERQAAFIAGAFASFPAHAKTIYGEEGVPLGAGRRLVQRDLARSMRLIAEVGAAAVYGGAIGAAIDSAMRVSGGFLSIDDLRKDRAEWWDPIAIDYRGHRVYTASPPANSFDALARLGLMERYDVRALGHNSAGFLHRFAEATKLGFWMRLRYAGDPDVHPPDIDSLLSNAYLDAMVARIDTARATPFVPPAAVAAAGEHTTHFVVADRLGNIVSATQTIGNVFGSRIMAPGTGIWLNNSLEYSTFEPKGNAMDAFPGRRKLSGDVPAIVMRNGRPWLAIGTPGGHTIGQTVPQMIMNAIDFGMDVQRAITAPRISFIEPDAIAVEQGIEESVRAALVAKGHKLVERRALGDAHGLTIEHDRSGRPVRFTGGTDPRGEGVAEGVGRARR